MTASSGATSFTTRPSSGWPPALRRWLKRLAWVLPIVATGYLGIILLCMAFGVGCRCVSHQVHQFRVRDSRAGPLVINTKSRMLFAAVEDAEEVAVYDIDRLASQPLARVPTEGYHEFAVNETDNKVYVVQAFSKKIRVIDGETFAFHDIHVPGLKLNMGMMAIDEARHRLYVFQPDNLDIGVIDTQTEAFLGPIGAGCCPSKTVKLAVDPETGLLYVVDQQAGVTVFESDGRQVAGPIAVGQTPRDVAVDGDRRRLYVTNSESRSMSVIDIAKDSPRRHTVIDSIVLRDQPLYVVLDASSHRAYVPFGDANRLGIIDLDAKQEAKSVELPFQPFTLAVDRPTNRVVIGSYDGHYTAVQTCPARFSWTHAWRQAIGPPLPEVPPTPVGYDDAEFAAQHRETVECERMFRTRTQCAKAPEFAEQALVARAVAERGARLAPDGSAAHICGVPSDYYETDLAAAGYYYAVPVIEPGNASPAVWSFHLDAKTAVSDTLPADAKVTRVTERPPSVWGAVLWRHSRCKTEIIKDACCAE